MNSASMHNVDGRGTPKHSDIELVLFIPNNDNNVWLLLASNKSYQHGWQDIGFAKLKYM